MAVVDTLINLFYNQAQTSPNKIAVQAKGLGLTYQQLDEMSNRLAHCLAANGILPGSLVPLCAQNPLDMVIGLWGILKSGAAYVPIDPEFPLERIKFMVADTAAKVVVADSLCTRFLEAAEGCTLIYADNNWASLQSYPATAPNVNISGKDLAYIIYTSGSTGQPKGVLIEHRSVLDYLNGLFAKLPYAGCRSFALGVSFAADSVITHVFGSVMAGGALHVFNKEDYNNVAYVHQYFKDWDIDCLKAVPSHWKSLSLNGKELLPSKILMFGGEALFTSMIRDILPTYTHSCILLNHYGPTETTVGQLLHIINENNTYGITIPIGQPFTDATAYILDENGNEMAGGATGELHISGTCVARGYLNRLELTAQKFVPNKNGTGTHARMYRTGDLVRRLPGGDIEFLGRIDDQVKIRGYRIELGEIENTLQKAPGVKQCAVSAKDAASGEKRLVGYVVCPNGYNKQAIIAYLEEKLPVYMVTQLIMPMDALPFFPNGKLDRKALPNPDASTLLTNQYQAPASKTEKLVAEIWKEVLGVERAGAGDNFFELGGSSLLAQKTVALLNTRHSIHVPVVKLYQFPKLKDLTAFIDGKPVTKNTNTIGSPKTGYQPKLNDKDRDIAVIGMAGRFPGADSIEELWEVLKSGRETTSFFTDEELDPSIPESLKSNPGYVKAKGVINNPKGFDAAFFGIPPKQAELMDPQQRVFLEVAWEAMERGGYAPNRYEGAIGVFAGVRFNSYYANNVAPNTSLIDNTGGFQVLVLNDKDFAATRVAYSLNLKGPAVSVQSACSTSLVAIAQAVESIRNGQCQMALAGGANISTPIKSGHLYNEGAILSIDGHCRPFDDAASGTIFSDGAGVVLLKSLSEAQKDGDNIIAVIKGIGLSNDGAAKGSFTAPSAEGQAAAIHMAINDAAIDPSEISYIEAHGTATPLGDPIEMEGLNIAFGEQDQKQYCAIGSIKSNFGHLTIASGVAGFIKACLSLQNKTLPPSINYNTANPHIDFENSPFYVNTSLKNWEAPVGTKRLAGVSSCGIGGTNAHVILSEPPVDETVSVAPRPVQLICWSAKAMESLDAFGFKLDGYFWENPDTDLARAAYTLHTGREVFNFRRFVVAGSTQDFIGQSVDKTQFHDHTKQVKEKHPELVFMFPGQGDQYVGMGKSLYETEKVFRQAMDECARLLMPYLGEDLIKVIYPTEATPEATEKLNNSGYSQPAMFSIGYALGRLWMSWGIYPSAFVGHSIGEFVSAYFAGVFSLPDALKLIATRGKMMAALPRGRMLSVRRGLEEIKPYLSDDIALAAANSPQLSVVAGSFEAIDKLSETLTQKGILNKVLATSHAFHSHMMEPVLAPFEDFIKSIPFNAPQVPIMSTVTGDWLKPEEATSPSYWARHLRATVYFGHAVQKLMDHNYGLYLEVGPGKSVATLARQQAAGKSLTAISSLEKEETERAAQESILFALGQLWINGVEPDWDAFYKPGPQRKLPGLPTYEFNKQEYWVEPPAPAQQSAPAPTQDNVVATPVATPAALQDRKLRLEAAIKRILEDASGIDTQGATPVMSFIEMGFDSLLLTQVALMLKKEFSLPITFRQLNESLGTLGSLIIYLDTNLPKEAAPASIPIQVQQVAQTTIPALQQNGGVLEQISLQLQQLAMQVAQLQGGNAPAVQLNAAPTHAIPIKLPSVRLLPELSAEEEKEIKKPFGAVARIEKHSAALSESQQKYLADFTQKYNEKTKGSKAYTQQHRAKMADPRVVSGFKPATKELVYSIVIKKSKGSRLWDIDGNEYIDSLNGFGSNMLGYQPDFLKNALIDQIEKGYEIGPQHELAGEVCEMICGFTNFDRAALCNTGSEAVLGAMRIARTVTGRSLIVAFAGSYHGITDEVIARGSKKFKTYPAAPGIMPEAVQNMLILDYGTDETLKIIEERGHEIAAVLVEPVQSRRCDFQPIAFLKQLREITEASKTVLVFDEVISGFRFHPGGVQAMFGIKADLGTYGKVVGGGLSIGVIAGAKQYMDALDGGWWQYGDESVPEIGVTYFAGTFVRHPLVLATAKASLQYFKDAGPQLQEGLNERGAFVAGALNAICRKLNVPIFIAQFGSLWRMRFLEEYPYMELFFTLMRYKGIHIQEGFPCFITTAHTNQDLQTIIQCFEESLVELKWAGFIPLYYHPATDEIKTLNTPPLPGAKLGKDQDGNPAWFVRDESKQGRFLMAVGGE